MHDGDPLTEQQAVEIAKRFITPLLKSNRTFSIAATRIDRLSLDADVIQVERMAAESRDGQSPEAQKMLQGIRSEREHWAVAFYPDQERPDEVTTQHADIVLVYDSGETRLLD